jgi:hypothetical protein
MGSYEIMFNRRSKYVYASLSDIEGYFVRKENWELLIAEFEGIGNYLK